MSNLNSLSIHELHKRLVSGEITALDLTKEAIENCKKDSCNCLEATCYEEALKKAKSITEVKEDEILKGIPYLAKDNYSTKGVETTASSNILNGYVPLFDATVISKLNRRGMILIGKTSMDELAMGGTVTTSHKGATLNPYDKERISGGSSSGSAVSIALGMVPFTLGSDTGDSVRKPASYNQVVGFKPTWGRVSRYGLFPFAPSLDCPSYFTRNVLDSAYILSAIAGHDEKDMSSSRRKKDVYEKFVKHHRTLPKVGYFKAVKDSIPSSKVRRAFDDLLKKIEKAGYQVIAYDYPIELLNALYPTYMIISCAEATSNNANLDGIRFGPKPQGDIKTYSEYMLEARTAGFSDLIKRRFVIGSFSLLSENVYEMFSRAQKARRMIVDNLNKFFDKADYFITPASFSKPKKINELSAAWSKTSDFLENIMTLANFGGNPSITLPLSEEDSLPFGVNITGRIFEDGSLFAFASDVEKITGIKDVTVRCR